jgi:hypothetical protein
MIAKPRYVHVDCFKPVTKITWTEYTYSIYCPRYEADPLRAF